MPSVMLSPTRQQVGADVLDHQKGLLEQAREPGDPMADSERLSEMYSAYSFWCRDSDRRELSRVNYVSQIEELFQPREYRTTGGSRRIWGWKRSAASEPQM